MAESPEITNKNALVLPYGPLYICAKFTQKVLWLLIEIAIGLWQEMVTSLKISFSKMLLKKPPLSNFNL